MTSSVFVPTFKGHKEAKITTDSSSEAHHVIPKAKIHYSKKHLQIYDPMQWSDFFEHKLMFEDLTPVYISGTKGPVLFCLHGLGLSGMSFSALA